MKTYKILITAALVFLTVSCDDFLTETPKSYIQPEVFYSTQTEVEIGLAGIYHCLARDAVFGQGQFFLDSGTDESYYNRRENENWPVSLYNYTTADGHIENYWKALYEGINLSNLFIENLKRDAFGETEYNRYLAEARFMRGLCHLILTCWWDEIPIRERSSVDQTSNDAPARPLPEVYDFIAQDLLFAAEWLPHAKDSDYVPGRANKMAARGFLARLYLRRAGEPLKDVSAYEKAIVQCDSIINRDGWHDLNESYRKHFLSYVQCVYDAKESLFEISFSYLRNMGLQTDGRVGGLNGLRFWLDGGLTGPSSYSMVNASVLLNNAYDPADERKAWNVPGIFYNNGNAGRQGLLDAFFCPGKYRRWEPADEASLDTAKPSNANEPWITLEVTSASNPNFTSVNYPMMRFADVLLMYAEALNATAAQPPQEAIDALDRVRTRAGLDPIGVAQPAAIASKEAFFNELVEERMRELCFEGVRWNDLKRWGLTETRLQKLASVVEGTTGFSATNDVHTAYLRAAKNFDPPKHLSLPYPLKEVTINNALQQKAAWGGN